MRELLTVFVFKLGDEMLTGEEMIVREGEREKERTWEREKKKRGIGNRKGNM